MNMRWRIMALAAMLTLALALPALAEDAHTLQTLLSRVPRAALTNGYLSYADHEGLAAVQQGAEAPASAADAAEHYKTPAGQAYLRSQQGTSAGFFRMMMYMGIAEDIARSSGFDPHRVRQSLSLGAASQQSWMAGPFDLNELARALTDKGYQETSHENGLALWCEGGDCDGGSRMDLARRDPAFLFGGDLGRHWPVAFAEGLVATAQDGPTIRLIAAQEGPTLADDARFKALLQAAELPEGQAPATVLQLMTAPHPGPAADGLLAIAMAANEEAVYVVVSLPWAGGLDEAGIAAIETLIQEAPLSRGGSLEMALQNQEGQLLAPRLVTEGEVTLLSLPFRFPAATQMAADKPVSLPFQFFAGLLQRNDLAWLPGTAAPAK